MSGIFGYFSLIPSHEKILDLAKTMEYTIKEVKSSELTLVCNLDIKSTNNKEIAVDFEKNGFIIFCGEIYNENISDPKKFILELYENRNFEKLKELNGSFIAAIYDNKNEKLTLINDRSGSIKLFYYYDKNYFYFSPKISPLMKIGVNKRLRKDALFDFFIFGYLLGEKTFDENVYRLLPASILEITKNNMNIQKYWTYQTDGNYDLHDKNELVDELGKRWQKAVDIRLKKNEKIIIQISGGLDSRAVLAAALKSTLKENIFLYTFGEEGSYDFEIGKNIAQIVGVQHIPLIAIKENFAEQYEKSFDDVEGMIDVTPYCATRMDQLLRPVSNKIYSGFMGGEVMGPLIFSKIKNLQLHTSTQYKIAKNILLNHHKLNDIQTIKPLFNQMYITDLDILFSYEKSLEGFKDISSKEFPNYCARWLYLNESYNYTSFCNFRYDNYFYYYKPFLDNDVLDFMLRVPPKFRDHKKLYKEMLIKHYTELYSLPTKNTYGLTLQTSHITIFMKRLFSFIQRKFNRISNYIVKHDFFFNKNQNYINYDDLLRINKEYQLYIKTMIDKVKKREFFNPKYIDTLWSLHLNGKKNYSRIFGLLVTFELLLEKYYDKSLDE
jgi:asparagine synthase (glutamine-hydrolysing)